MQGAPSGGSENQVIVQDPSNGRTSEPQQQHLYAATQQPSSMHGTPTNRTTAAGAQKLPEPSR